MSASHPNALLEYELMALDFLARHGSDCVGVIDTEEKFAAAIVYNTMRAKGLVLASTSDDGPVYSLSNKGRALLTDASTGREGSA